MAVKASDVRRCLSLFRSWTDMLSPVLRLGRRNLITAANEGSRDGELCPFVGISSPLAMKPSKWPFMVFFTSFIKRDGFSQR